VSTGFDAWNTPGWDVQNPVYLTGSATTPELPAGVHAVKVTGTFLGPAGKGAYGQVRFIPSLLHHTIDGITVLLPPQVRGEVRNGELRDATLYAVPTDLVWTVVEAVGPARQRYDVLLPANAASEIALLDLERV
jgi:hypothetical protein